MGTEQILGHELVRETYSPNQMIFFEGDLDRHFYIIESGKVQIFAKNKFGKRVDLVTIEEGESFGEFALIDKRARNYAAQALTEAVIIKVSEEAYQKLLDECPPWASSMLKSFVIHFSKMNDLLLNMSEKLN